MESPMPIINKPPIMLTDFEIVAVVAFLQAKDTPGDFSKVTAKRDWEHYFGKKLTVTKKGVAIALLAFTPLSFDPTRMALPNDSPEQIVRKMFCFACYKIPTIEFSKAAVIGPLLIMKTTAFSRIKSQEYQKEILEGKARAMTPKEYAIESIIHPEAFIVPGFVDNMPRGYGDKFTATALEKLVDFLLTLDENAAQKEGLDRSPDEKE